MVRTLCYVCPGPVFRPPPRDPRPMPTPTDQGRPRCGRTARAARLVACAPPSRHLLASLSASGATEDALRELLQRLPDRRWRTPTGHGCDEVVDGAPQCSELGGPNAVLVPQVREGKPTYASLDRVRHAAVPQGLRIVDRTCTSRSAAILADLWTASRRRARRVRRHPRTRIPVVDAALIGTVPPAACRRWLGGRTGKRSTPGCTGSMCRLGLSAAPVG